MRILLLFLTIYLFTLSTAFSQFAGGSGTEEDPYQVETVEQLQEIQNHLDKHFIQISNIDASVTETWNDGKGFEPIGTLLNEFRGSYEGQYLDIEGLHILRSNTDYVGLFGYLKESNLEKIVISNSTIKGRNFTGTLVGRGVTVTLSNLTVDSSVFGNENTGGVIGYIQEGEITNAFASGTVEGTWHVGGIAGTSDSGTITFSNTNNNINGNSKIGGLVGNNDGSGVISKCSTSGNIEGSSSVGGLVGTNERGTINYSFSLGNVTGGNVVGGLVGSHRRYSISNSYSLSLVTGFNRSGGLVGYTNTNGRIYSSFFGGHIIDSSNGSGSIGGIIGEHNSSSSSTYWDIESSNQTLATGRGSSSGMYGLSTNNMTGESAEINMTDLNFDDLWASIPNNYPKLLWSTPYFKIGNLNTNSPITEGQEFIIEATIENIGGVADTQSVVLKNEDGNILDSTYNLILESGQTETVALQWQTEPSDEGVYTFTIESEYDRVSFEFSVRTIPAKVNLTFPDDQQEGISLLPVLEWSQTELADHYQLQVSALSDFSNTFLDIDNMETLTFEVTDSLDHLTTYYWRVRGKADIGDGDWSSVWSFKTIIQSPEKVVLQSPEDDSSNISISPSLQWAASERAKNYRAQLSESEDFLEFVQDSTGIMDRSFTPEVLKYNTLYHWRVKALNEGGESEWSESRSFFTEFAIPKPTIVSPETGTEVELPVTFFWNHVDGAEDYLLEISLDESFDTLIDISTETDQHSKQNTIQKQSDWNISQTVGNLDSDKKYYWRVKASNSDGESDWSEVRSIQTKPEPIQGIVSLLSPESGAELNTGSVQFSWSTIDLLDNYTLQLSESNSFSTLSVDTTLSKFGELKVGNIAENCSQTSALHGNRGDIFGGSLEKVTDEIWFSFTVSEINTTTYFKFISPEGFGIHNVKIIAPDNSVLSSRNIDEVFEYSVPTFVQGTYYISVGVTNGESIFLNTGQFLIESSDQEFTDESDDTLSVDLNITEENTYYWRVKASGENIQEKWSETRSVQIVNPALFHQVELELPLNESTNTELPTEFKWNALDEADHYELEIAKSPTFSSVIAVREHEPVTYTSELLSDTTTYSWRVRATIDGQQTAWSEVWEFTTELRVPEIPVWQPDNGEQDVSTTPLIAWSESSRSEYFDIQLADNPEFSNPTIDLQELSTTEYQVANELEDGITYHWRVRAGNDSGYSDWSAPLSFTTQMNTSTEITESPQVISLQQNYPNPFNPSTIIQFGMPEAAFVQLGVYNMLGQRVALLANEQRSKGWHEVTLDASNLSSGTYVYRLQIGDEVTTKKLMLIK